MEKVLDQDQKVWIKKHGLKIMTESLEKNKIKNDFKTYFIKSLDIEKILVVHYDKSSDLTQISIHKSNDIDQFQTSLFQRIKQIISLMFYGFSYINQITLDKKQINELKIFLNKL